MEQSPCPVVLHFLRVWNRAAKSGNTDLGSCPSGVFLCSSAFSCWKIPEHRERHSGSPHTHTSWWWSLGKSPTTKGSTRRRARQKDCPRSLSDGDYHHWMRLLVPHISKTRSMENSAFTFQWGNRHLKCLHRKVQLDEPQHWGNTIPSLTHESVRQLSRNNIHGLQGPYTYLPSGIKRQVVSK